MPQGGRSPGEPGGRGTVETRKRSSNRQGGITLAARPFRTPSPEPGRTRTGHLRSGRRTTRRSRKAMEHGRGTGEVAPPIGIADRSRDAVANRRKGSCVERRVQSLPGQALKGEPRGRARMKHAGEIATGARRRGRSERRGRNRTRRRQLRGRWLVVIGLRRGGRNLERADGAGGRRHGRPGNTPKRGERPRKVREPFTRFRARRAKTTRWMNHEVGTPNP